MSSFPTFTISIILNLHRYIFCVLVAEERICLRVAENEGYQPEFKPYSNLCDGWFCWQSQLSLINKATITTVINDFRNDNADSILNMNKLVWHWALEQEAIRASSTCQRTELEYYSERRYINGLGFGLKCENGCLYEKINQNPSQSAFVNILSELLRKNALQDFDEFNEFRRANFEFFGCSLVVRNRIQIGIFEDIFNFVCVFCTTEKKIETKFRDDISNSPQCSNDRIYGGDKYYPQLCKHKYYANVYMCEPLHACQKETNRPPFLDEQPGQVAELIVVETTSGPILLVNKTQSTYDRHLQHYNVSINTSIDTEGVYLRKLDAYSQFSNLLYKYTPNDLEMYKEVVKILDSEKNVINPAIRRTNIMFFPGEAAYGTRDGWCCISLFLFSFTCFLILFVMIYYTYNESKHKKTYKKF